MNNDYLKCFKFGLYLDHYLWTVLEELTTHSVLAKFQAVIGRVHYIRPNVITAIKLDMVKAFQIHCMAGMPYQQDN